jgi:hypothetical protein
MSRGRIEWNEVDAEVLESCISIYELGYYEAIDEA